MLHLTEILMDELAIEPSPTRKQRALPTRNAHLQRRRCRVHSSQVKKGHDLAQPRGRWRSRIRSVRQDKVSLHNAI